MRINAKVAASVLALLSAGCSANARFDVSEYQPTSGTKPVTTAALPQQDHAMGSAPQAMDTGPAPYAPTSRTGTLGWDASRPETGGSNIVHVVRPGDTLYGVAKSYGTPMTQIYKANGLVNDRLTPGQHLIIPRVPVVSIAARDGVATR